MKAALVGVALLMAGCASSTPAGPSATPLPLPPLYTLTGTGAQVFDVPTTVTRLKITGDMAKGSENFILVIGRDLLVNEILGTGCLACVGNHYEGTFLSKGGVGHTEKCVGITWTITELR